MATREVQLASERSELRVNAEPTKAGAYERVLWLLSFSFFPSFSHSADTFFSLCVSERWLNTDWMNEWRGLEQLLLLLLLRCCWITAAEAAQVPVRTHWRTHWDCNLTVVFACCLPSTTAQQTDDTVPLFAKFKFWRSALRRAQAKD